MRLRRRKYDPYLDLERVLVDLVAELQQAAKDGDLSAEDYGRRRAAIGDFIRSAMVYAIVGRDRKKLGPEWVAEVEANARHQFTLLSAM